MRNVCRRPRARGAGAAAALAFSALVFSATCAAAQMRAAALAGPRLDASGDAQDARDDALLATPNPVTPAPLANLYATAPDLEAQAPSAQLRANALLPFGWNSNADELSRGGAASAQWLPSGNLSWASPLGDLPLRATLTGFAQTERYFESAGADIDKTGGAGRLQAVDPGDDQAFSPYLALAPRRDFTPTFRDPISAREDINIGFNKRFNFDANFARVASAANTTGATVWSLGLTVFVQRRLRAPQVSSSAAFVIPSLTYASGQGWSVSFAVEALSRRFDGNSGGLQEIQPIATVETIVPAAVLGGERNAALLGHPAFDLQGAYVKLWNRLGGGCEQWQAVAALKMGWRF